MFGISAFSQTAFSSLASGVVLGTAQVDANATVTADGYSLALATGSITANATVSSNAYAIRTTTPSIREWIVYI